LQARATDIYALHMETPENSLQPDPPLTEVLNEVDRESLPEDTALLRYMSFAKLVAMLSRNALHLCRLDALGDKDRFEGSLPRGQRKRIINDIMRELDATPPPALLAARKRLRDAKSAIEWHAAAQVRAYTLALRRSAYVSCWSQGPESEAMWRLYCEGNEGVAMVTTYGKLRASLQDPNLLITPVRYIDYRRDRLPGREYFQQLIHKRIGFVHEREVRVIYWSAENLTVRGPHEQEEENHHSILIPWDVASAVDSVIVSPFTPSWYPEAVGAVLRAFSPPLVDRLVASELGEEPIF
jgi:hypothetical protein